MCFCIVSLYVYTWLFKGADIFCATVNLEVQIASEAAIAAVERNGGVITTSYYDPRSLRESPALKHIFTFNKNTV